MSFEWKLYIDLASELIQCDSTSGLQEASYRTAISRSYYGVFSIAQKLLIEKGEEVYHSNEHKFVREKFIYSSKTIEKKIGESIKRLWFERKAADYEEDASIDKLRAEKALLSAQKTLPLLEQVAISNSKQ